MRESPHISQLGAQISTDRTMRQDLRWQTLLLQVINYSRPHPSIYFISTELHWPAQDKNINKCHTGKCTKVMILFHKNSLYHSLNYSPFQICILLHKYPSNFMSASCLNKRLLLLSASHNCNLIVWTCNIAWTLNKTKNQQKGIRISLINKKTPWISLS